MTKLGVIVLASVILSPAVLAEGRTATGAGKQNFLERQTTRSAELKQERETRRTEFKKKLTEIKDARKKEIAQKLSDNLCRARDNRVKALNQHLQTMTTLLARVSSKASEAQAKGKDISTVTAAVTTAKLAIADAQSAVDALANQACGLTISGDETKLGKEAKTARDQLAGEFASAKEKVKAARKAVSAAIQALARVLGEKVPQPVKESTEKL